MYKALFRFLSVVSLVSCSLPARAQTADQIGIRAQGMAGAFTAVADDATATWWNPAGLAAGAYANAILEMSRRREPSEADESNVPVRVGGFSVAYPALGLSYYRLRVSQIPPVTDSTAATSASRQEQGTATPRFPTLALNQFGATVGQSLGRHLVVASTVKLVAANDETHAGLDVGALARLGSARFGVTVRNVREVSFPTPAGPIELPRTVRAGAAIGGDRAMLAGDVDLRTVDTASGEERRWALGTELWTTGRSIGVRGGVSSSTVGDTRTAVSGGASLAVRRGTYIDGAITGGEDELRHGWGVAFRLTF